MTRCTGLMSCGLIVVVSVVTAAMVGCGGSDSSPEAPTPPSVVETAPEDGATGVNLNPVIQVWFDRAIDPATLDTLAFRVEGASHYEVIYDDVDHRADLYLSGLLAASTGHSVTLSGEIESSEGAAMGDDYTFDFTTGPLDCDHLADWMEPNDIPAAAKQIEVGKRYTVLASCGPARYDYYKFTITEAKTITIHCYWVYSNVTQISWYENFLRANGDYYNTLGCWFTDGYVPTSFFSFLPGTYYILVGGTDSDEETGVYDIMLEATAPCEDDDYEDNDFFDQATAITPGSHTGLRACYADADYYTVNLNAGQTLTVTVTSQEGYGANSFEIYNPSHVRLGYNNGGSSPQALSVEDVAVSGDYYLLVRWWRVGVTHYDLDVEVTD